MFSNSSFFNLTSEAVTAILLSSYDDVITVCISRGRPQLIMHALHNHVIMAPGIEEL